MTEGVKLWTAEAVKKFMNDARRRYAKDYEAILAPEIMRQDAIGLVACVDSVAALEREACAKVAEIHRGRYTIDGFSKCDDCGEEIAAAILARGKTSVDANAGMTLVLNYRFVCNRCGSTIWASDTADSRWTPCTCMTHAGYLQSGGATLDLVAREVAKEREACAQIAAADYENGHLHSRHLVDAIRERGKTIVPDSPAPPEGK